jgi:hypothetical protein
VRIRLSWFLVLIVSWISVASFRFECDVSFWSNTSIPSCGVAAHCVRSTVVGSLTVAFGATTSLPLFENGGWNALNVALPVNESELPSVWLKLSTVYENAGDEAVRPRSLKSPGSSIVEPLKSAPARKRITPAFVWRLNTRDVGSHVRTPPPAATHDTRNPSLLPRTARGVRPEIRGASREGWEA